MMPRHHLDPATIVSYAAGAMSPELSAIVATHLGGCAMCRKAITSAEDIGGLLMEQQQPPPAARQPGHLRAQMLARLESGVPNVAEPAVRTVQDPDQLPRPLQPLALRLAGPWADTSPLPLSLISAVAEISPQSVEVGNSRLRCRRGFPALAVVGESLESRQPQFA